MGGGRTSGWLSLSRLMPPGPVWRTSVEHSPALDPSAVPGQPEGRGLRCVGGVESDEDPVRGSYKGRYAGVLKLKIKKKN